MKHIHPFIVITICILFLVPYISLHSAGIRDDFVSQTGIPRQLREIVNENRKIVHPQPHPDLVNIIDGYVFSVNFEEDAKIAKIVKERRGIAQGWRYNFNFGSVTDPLDILLTHEQIYEEIHLIFNLLRNGYAAYKYFGGDDVFFPIRDSALEKLAGMDNPMRVSTYFNNILNLLLGSGAIADNHFHISNMTYGIPKLIPYMNNNLILRRNPSHENSFITEIDGTFYKVLEVLRDAQPIEGILPTITQDGEFAWAFGLVTVDRWQNSATFRHDFFHNNGQNVFDITVILENTDTGISHSRVITLQAVDVPVRQSGSSMITTQTSNGVMIIENRTLSARSQEDLADFYNSASAFRDKPVAIIDLRGNKGGQGEYPSEWVRLYSGQTPTGSLFYSHKSQVVDELLGLSRANNSSITEMDIEDEYYDDSTGLLPISTQEIIKNENVIIVLMDKDTASAGELFVRNLRQLENVLFVGTNTKGALLTSDVGRTTLPHSNMNISFGTALRMPFDLSQFEGIGFMPDLYIPPEESLERVFRFIERYKLLENLQ